MLAEMLYFRVSKQRADLNVGTLNARRKKAFLFQATYPPSRRLFLHFFVMFLLSTFVKICCCCLFVSFILVIRFTVYGVGRKIIESSEGGVPMRLSVPNGDIQ